MLKYCIPIQAMPQEPSYNPNTHALSIRIDTGNPGHRIPIHTLTEQIKQMNMDAELRTGHCAGLLAAQLTLNYLDHELHPVYEQAIDIGTLAMLGCYITSRVNLTPTEMDYAATYQRVILFARVLDDLQPEATYSGRVYPSIIARSQQRIRLNLFGYSWGKKEFSQVTDQIVQDYKTIIRSTPPTGEDIALYRTDTSITDVVERFLRTRRRLYEYIPQLTALNEKLWRYARHHYARYLKKQ